MNVEGIKNKLKGLFSALGILFVLLFLCVLFAVKAPGFVSVRNLYYVLQQVSVVGILTIGQTYVIISKGIDLSQGAIIGFSMRIILQNTTHCTYLTDLLQICRTV